jgi:glutamate-1-semialdehyde 2,1-aminomutase
MTIHPDPAAAVNHTVTTSRSADLFRRALRVLPGGVSRNTVLRDPHPLYADHGEGCRLIDIEGVSRVDFSNNMCSLIHGHAHPGIVRAVSEQVARGSAFMMATPIEVEYAEHMCSRNDHFEKMRFVNSGTEALMVSLKTARAFTGRPKVAKVEGAYHGGYDYAEVSQSPKPHTWGDADRPNSVPLAHGTPASALDDVVVIPFNDVDRAVAILDEHAGDLACVLLDLMPHRVGLNPADRAFVDAMRDWTARNGSLLVLDEVITFRTEFGGLQNLYDLTPDLTALGKMIGGGFPVGAVTGRAEVMDVMNPLSDRFVYPHSGTFSANPISTAAGLAAMTAFDRAAIRRLNALGERARLGIADAIGRTGARACVTGCGSMFRVHMKEQPPHNFREAFTTPEENARLKALLDHMFDAGFVMINTCTGVLSSPMGEDEIDGVVAALEAGFETIRGMP